MGSKLQAATWASLAFLALSSSASAQNVLSLSQHRARQAQAAANPASAVTPAPAPAASAPNVTFEEIVGGAHRPRGYNLTAIGLGAIGGVVALNALLPALGLSAVAASAPATAAGLEATLAVSRIYAVTGAVGGGVIGQLIYNSLP